MRFIVCGGRDYRDRKAVFAALDLLNERKGIDFLIQGGATGADMFAWEWADERGVRCGSYPADWEAHGKKAGPIRNQKMLDEGRADGLIAFPGGRGTADMVARAEKAGLKVWHPVKEPTPNDRG
ncbi:hypothetical protein HMPREF9946_03119 [Acetobacteraceae bacterium AT-5844]|nr:hypothetical protein HMPREF9946_03119 [Acetobacteraceae bacterium AT-5844]